MPQDEYRRPVPVAWGTRPLGYITHVADITPSELHRQILIELCRYSASCVVEAAMDLLSAKYSTELEGLMILPWNILRLVKWALRDEQVRLRIGRRITPQEFDGLRQRLQELVGKDFLAKPQPEYLMMRSHFPQFDFQRPEGWGLSALASPNCTARRQPSLATSIHSSSWASTRALY